MGGSLNSGREDVLLDQQSLKSKHPGVDDEDNSSMLPGIAHDPIQRSGTVLTWLRFKEVITTALKARKDGEKKDDRTLPKMNYALDGEDLKAKSLPSTFPRGSVIPHTIFVTGATGFLGPAILDNILSRNDGLMGIALVRADPSSKAFQRIKTACVAYSA
ncbi:hypothetical protein ACLMJK_007516 [Lecanora helva]